MIGIELPRKDFKKVRSPEKHEIREKPEKARADLKHLYNYLCCKGYQQATGYLNRGSKNIFTDLDRWLRTGLITLIFQ